jgi:hypothetical protein
VDQVLRSDNVFCLDAATELEARTAEAVLDLNRWRFWVLSAHQLELRFGDRKSLAMRALDDVQFVAYAKLKEEIEKVLELAGK